MRIDLRNLSLTTRHSATEELAYWTAQLETAPAGLIIVDFGDKLATGSWIDGFLVGLIRHVTADTRLLVVSAREETRDHLSLVLEKRETAAFVVSSLDELASGDLQVLGHVANAGREVLAAIQRFGEATVHDIATTVEASIEATQLRLNALMEQRLITRTRLGRAYLYTLPVMQALEDLIPA